MNYNDHELKPEERATYLKMVAKRARKLAELADSEAMGTVPAAQDFLVAQHAHRLFLAVFGLCPNEQRAAFLVWMLERVRTDHGCCFLCGKPKAHGGDDVCAACNEELEQVNVDLGLTPNAVADFQALTESWPPPAAAPDKPIKFQDAIDYLDRHGISRGPDADNTVRGPDGRD